MKISSLKTGGLWQLVQLQWNVGPFARNMWSFKTGGLPWQWALKISITVVSSFLSKWWAPGKFLMVYIGTCKQKIFKRAVKIKLQSIPGIQDHHGQGQSSFNCKAGLILKQYIALAHDFWPSHVSDLIIGWSYFSVCHEGVLLKYTITRTEISSKLLKQLARYKYT